MTTAELHPYQDKTVVVRLSDGEVATVKIILVDSEHEDIVVDIIHTDRPEQYKGLPNSAYTIRSADIVSLSEISG